MKKILFAMALLMSSSALAGVTRGYILENDMGRSGKFVFYAGLNYENTDVQMGLEHFTDAQIDVISNCMEKKATHAIEVVTETTGVKVPTGIPGRSTTVHSTEVQSVFCVQAPGFLSHWRKQFGIK